MKDTPEVAEEYRILANEYGNSMATKWSPSGLLTGLNEETSSKMAVLLENSTRYVKDIYERVVPEKYAPDGISPWVNILVPLTRKIMEPFAKYDTFIPVMLPAFVGVDGEPYTVRSEIITYRLPLYETPDLSLFNQDLEHEYVETISPIISKGFHEKFDPILDTGGYVYMYMPLIPLGKSYEPSPENEQFVGMMSRFRIVDTK